MIAEEDDEFSKLYEALRIGAFPFRIHDIPVCILCIWMTCRQSHKFPSFLIGKVDYLTNCLIRRQALTLRSGGWKTMWSAISRFRRWKWSLSASMSDITSVIHGYKKTPNPAKNKITAKHVTTFLIFFSFVFSLHTLFQVFSFSSAHAASSLPLFSGDTAAGRRR